MSEETDVFLSQLAEMERSLAQFASIVATYHQELISRGFSPEQALSLVLSFQASIIAGSRSGS